MQSGFEVITAEFDDAEACAAAAVRTFQGVTDQLDMRPLMPVEEAQLIEGTMIVFGQDSSQIGMFSCNPSQTLQSSVN